MKKFLAAAVSAGAALALTLPVPSLAAYRSILAPMLGLPIFWLILRHGPASGLLHWALVVAGLSALNLSDGVAMMVAVYPVSFALALTLRAGGSPDRALAVCIAVALAILALLAVIVPEQLSDARQKNVDMTSQIIDARSKQLENATGMDLQQQARMASLRESLITWSRDGWIGLHLAELIFSAMINLLFAALPLRAAGCWPRGWPPLIVFRWSDWWCLAPILALATLLASRFWPPARVAGLAVFIPFAFLYLVHGMGVFLWFLGRMRGPLYLRLILVMSTVIFLDVTIMALALMGLTDVWWDFRGLTKIAKPKVSDDEIDS